MGGEETRDETWEEPLELAVLLDCQCKPDDKLPLDQLDGGDPDAAYPHSHHTKGDQPELEMLLYAT